MSENFINWFPGHIAKAIRELKTKINLVDVVVEIRDARLPKSSSYKDIKSLIGSKSRLIILNKSDLADDKKTDFWIKKISEEEEVDVIKTVSNNQKNINILIQSILSLSRVSIDRQIKKGLLQRSARVVVVGLPNVGKSSFINKLVRCAKTKVAAKAGVTKEHSWVRINPKLDLLDTPGVIPMKIDNQEVAIKLASISSIGENAFDKEFVSCEILKLLDEEYIPIVKKHYNLSENDDLSLENIAKSRNLILKNSVLDIRRCCEMFLKDFSLGKIGRFTLD